MLAPRGSIQICMTVNQIIMDYEDTPEREEEVTRLLELLCKNHFREV